MRKLFLCVMVVVSVSIVTGCATDEVPMEYGFTETGDPDTSYRCAYRLEQSEFESKDNVTVKAYYGHLDKSGTAYANISYRTYFVGTDVSDPWYETAHLINEISGDEFASEKYYCTGTIKANGKKTLIFGHSEILKIPAELFDREEGKISFILTEYITDRNEFGSGKSFTINFKLHKEKVALFVPK